MEWKRCFFPALCPSASFPCFPTPSGSYHLPGEAKPQDSALPTLSSAERKGGDSNSEKGSHREDEDQDEITGTTRHVLRPSGLF